MIDFASRHTLPARRQATILFLRTLPRVYMGLLIGSKNFHGSMMMVGDNDDEDDGFS